MKGYLVPFVPHIYRHVPARYHRLLHQLVLPQTMAEVAGVLGLAKNTVS